MAEAPRHPRDCQPACHRREGMERRLEHSPVPSPGAARRIDSGPLTHYQALKTPAFFPLLAALE